MKVVVLKALLYYLDGCRDLLYNLVSVSGGKE